MLGTNFACEVNCVPNRESRSNRRKCQRIEPLTAPPVETGPDEQIREDARRRSVLADLN